MWEWHWEGGGAQPAVVEVGSCQQLGFEVRWGL